MKTIVLSSNCPDFSHLNLRLFAFICGSKKLRLCALLALSSFAASPGFSSPQIVCSNPGFDFGMRIAGNAITNQFILKNKGDEPLEIVQIKNCCGVETEVVPMMVPPGSNAVCTSVFTTKNRYGAQDKQILLVTNDKKNLYYDLRMTGTLLKPVEFEPRYIRLKDVLPDAVVSETITVTNLLEQEISLESVSTTLDGLAAEVVRDDASRLQETTGKHADARSAPRRSWMIRLKSKETLLPIGAINGQVILNFSSGAVNVPLIGNVDPVIQATPATISCGTAVSGAIERLAILRSGDHREFNVLSAKLVNADGKVETKEIAEGKWQLKLTIQPTSIKSDSSIFIKTSVVQQETITIPLAR